MIEIGIVGGTGYTGVELLRLLLAHPEVSIRCITSRAEAGLAVADLFPSLRGRTALRFCEPDAAPLADCDCVFFATPNGVAMRHARALWASKARLIDLSADFRLRSVSDWQRWYQMEHACPELVGEAVYGLPEFFRERIRTAKLIANPGCYPTAVQLGFYPLIKSGLVDLTTLIADAKSGVSGAGRKAETHTLFAEASDNFKAYGASGHRHLPEIVQGLSTMAAADVGLTFVPHLTPMVRGIHATLYARILPAVDDRDWQQLFVDTYRGEPFVDVMPTGSHPETRSVRGANTCRIAIHRPQQGQTLVVLSVIDNLVKGAAGQAIHNMNLMFGFAEELGLCPLPLLP